MTAAVKGKGSVEFLLVLMGLAVATYVDSSSTECGPFYSGGLGKLNGEYSEVNIYGPHDRDVGSTWRLTCDPGYNVKGHSEATTKCQYSRGNPTWIPLLECVPNQYCDPFPDVPNGRSHLEIGISSHNAGLGSAHEVTCDIHYHIEGTPSISKKIVECVMTGYGLPPTWAPKVKCVPDRVPDRVPDLCPQHFFDVGSGKFLVDHNNGKHAYDVGSKHEVLCDPGYHIDGKPGESQASFQCLHDEKGSRWSPMLQCVRDASTNTTTTMPSKCSPFFDVGFGKFLVKYYDGNFFDVGSKQKVRCDAGYHIEGKPGESQASFECSMDVNGMPTWTPQPKCVA